MSDISNESTTVPQRSLNNPIITDSSKISPTTWNLTIGHGKMGYLMGEKKAPVVDDPNYAIWDAENSMIFELTLKLGEIRQGEDNVTKYFNSLKRIWQDLDLFNTYEWKSAEDGLHHKKTMEDNQIFIIEHLLALLKSNLTTDTSSVSLAHTVDHPSTWSTESLGQWLSKCLRNPPSIPTHIHASSSSVTDLSLPSHFGPSLEISAPEPGLGLAPIVPAQDLDLDLPIALRKGTRACTKHPIVQYISYSNLSDNYRAFTTNISKLVVPRNIQEALDEPSWKLAVFEEMNALKKNGTWEVVDLPREKKVVGCKWVFTIKSKADGSVERYKARLVAKVLLKPMG
ncbi:putative mitochondrial protein [Vitis vinifera]|uniref:Putative mitochondrial protein n=1 Tax=Vitis vinifera TaxID=29760 RepID=A0A438CP95_VITVI|nr:putative mitochondrial protein [Vitis vinifera]